MKKSCFLKQPTSSHVSSHDIINNMNQQQSVFFMLGIFANFQTNNVGVNVEAVTRTGSKHSKLTFTFDSTVTSSMLL